MEDKPMKRKIKDSVFTLPFRQPEYLLELYHALHPDDQDICQDEINRMREFNLVKDAKAEEREKNISALVRRLKKLGMKESEVASALIEDYSLIPIKAGEKVKKYWVAN